MKNAVLKKALLIVTGILVVLFVLYVLYDMSVFDFYPKDDATVIKQYNEHYKEFQAVQQYASKTKGLLYVSSLHYKVHKAKNTGGDAAIHDTAVADTINTIISELHFQSIYELEDGTVQFIKQESADESGIAYSPTEELSFYVIDTEVLGDGWYYYRTIHV